MVAITFALPAESSGFLRQLQSKRIVRTKGARIFFGEIGGRAVAVLHTGVGRSRCRRDIEILLHTAKPELLISSGFAGSLTRSLSIGDIIVAENFSDHTIITKVLEGETAATTKVHVVRLLTVDSMVDSSEERTRMAQRTGAGAIDMETEEIAKLCSSHGVRLFSVRVISDSLEAGFPAPPEVLFDLDRQRTDIGKLLLHLLSHPATIPRLIKFSRQIAKARDALTAALIALLRGDKI